MEAVRVIKTPEDYEKAFHRLNILMDKGDTLSNNEGQELEVLALLIRFYERSHSNWTHPDPVEAIKFCMEQQNLTRKDLIPYLGSLSKVSEVLSYKKPLSLNMIRKLCSGLDVPADIFIGGTGYDTVDIANAHENDWQKFPIREMFKRGYFEGFTGNIHDALADAEELLTRFMHGFSAKVAVFCRAQLHQNGKKSMDEYAFKVWSIAVLKKAESKKLKPYKQGVITAEWLQDLIRQSWLSDWHHCVQEYLEKSGIALVIEPPFEKTYLDGAAFLNGKTPVIALTLRHDRMDNFWFSLIHELIHVQKHLSMDHPFMLDDFDTPSTLDEENEANTDAGNALIPGDKLATFIALNNFTTKHIIDFANTLRIHPAIVAGRIRHEKKNWKILNRWSSKRGKVRHLFN